METLDAIEKIQTDFESGNEPFDDVTFPEERLLNELPYGSMEGKATLLSIFSTFDYNRNANQLVDNLIELHEKYEEYFDAWYVNTEAALEERLKEVAFRYPSRDAHAWAKTVQFFGTSIMESGQSCISLLG